MFNIGFGELMIIVVVLIIAVGPDRLPALMRTIGKTLRSVRQASQDLRESVGLDEMMNQDLMGPQRKSLTKQLPKRDPNPGKQEVQEGLPNEEKETEISKVDNGSQKIEQAEDVGDESPSGSSDDSDKESETVSVKSKGDTT